MPTPSQALTGLLVVGLGVVGVPLDSAVNIAFPYITRAFGIPEGMIQWVVICYVLTHSSLLLVGGKLGDLFGYRRVFGAGIAILAVSFVLSGTTDSFALFLLYRVLQGLGAALVLGCGPALATSFYPESERTRIVGIYTMMFAIGMALGPTLGGFLVDAFGWSAVFWFRAPIAFLALVLLCFVPRADSSQDGARQPLDLVGAGLLVLAISTLLLALNLSQRPAFGWTAALLSGISIASVIGFVRQELTAPDPIVRIDVFRNLDFSVLNIANGVVNGVGFAVMLLVPFYLDRVTGLPVTVTGALLASSPAGMVVFSYLGGRLAEHVRPSIVGLAGAVSVGVGVALVAAWPAEPDYALILVTLPLVGAGMGLFQVSYLDIVTGTLPRRDRGVAGSLTMVTRTIGVVCGATLLTLLYETRERAALLAGEAPLDAFLAGFGTTFTYAGAALLAFLAITMIRPRIWFG